MPRVLGIDIGFTNLALVSVETSDEHEIIDVTSSRVIDIAKVGCLPGCQLHHSGNVVDRMNHTFAKYQQHFEQADEIFIEAQPLVGLVHVEALIYSRYREKATMVQPVAVQKHFRWPRNDYDAKKQAAVVTARPYTGNLADLARKHDIADAFCLVLYTCQVRKAKLSAARWKAERRDVGFSGGNPFSAFVCKGHSGCLTESASPPEETSVFSPDKLTPEKDVASSGDALRSQAAQPLTYCPVHACV